MKEAAREHVMQSLMAMAIMDLSKKEHRSTEELLREFRRSVTYQNLFDAKTGLWMNGPDYIAEDFLLFR